MSRHVFPSLNFITWGQASTKTQKNREIRKQIAHPLIIDIFVGSVLTANVFALAFRNLLW